MKKGLLVILVSLFASVSWSATTLNQVLVNAFQKAAQQEAETQGLKWKINDSADYSFKMGMISGKIHSFVREEVAEGLWVQQDMDMGFLGKQKIEILFDKATGQVLEIRANGQKQDPPSAEDFELVEMKEAQITVPAGSFRCVYMNVLNKKDNTHSEAWMNPQEIPMSGMIKQVSPGQFGQVVVELTGFNKQ